MSHLAHILFYILLNLRNDLSVSVTGKIKDIFIDENVGEQITCKNIQFPPLFSGQIS